VRVFLDTNVLVSAFASRGLCAEVLELVLLDHDLILGRNVLRELERALREKVRLPAARSAEIVDFVLGEAAQVVENAEAATVNVDAADALVMGEALAGQAESFVTGDAALQRLATVGALKIVSPRQFWEILRAGNT
jgi:putative PIN family toxin of toxin-antitoxin system